MDKGLLIVKACFRTGSLDREVLHNNICKQLENSNVVVLPFGWEVNYYPPGTEVVVGKTNEETRTCPEGGNMNGNIKLIIEIPTDLYEITKAKVDKNMTDAPLSVSIANGIPLDNDSERAETQAYFAGEAYGWEQGRKALINSIKSKIETDLSWEMYDEYGNETALHKSLMDILDSVGKESGE